MTRLSPREFNDKPELYSLLQTPRKDATTYAGDQTTLVRRTKRDKILKSLVFPVVGAVIITLVAFCVLRRPLKQQSKLWRPLPSSRQGPPSQFVENISSFFESTTATLTRQQATTWYLSDVAFEGILKQYRLSMLRTNYQVWLPLVLLGDNILIANNHLSEVKTHRRFQIFTAMMLKALNLTNKDRIPEGSRQEYTPLLERSRAIPFVMTLGDHKSCERTKFPRFGWCTTTDATCTTFALPTFSVYREAPQTSLSSNSSWFHDRLEQRYPWSSKKALAVWRGSATGSSVNHWYDLPRAQLVNYSIHHPDLMDAAFTHAKQFKNLHPDEEAKLREHSRFANFIRFPNFQMYRAVVDIDGNSWSNRFGRLLCMNSAVIKVQPSNENYFYRQLQPWVHYIPVAADMSDFLEALVFATSNETQDQVRSIVHSANEFCRTRLTKESMAHDIFLALNSYVRLLGTNETRWRQWEKVLKDYERKMDLVEPDLVSFDTP